MSHDPDKIKALHEWLQHPPKNASELQTFLGFAGYYPSFVEGFTQIAKPLHQLVAQQSKKQPAKKLQFQWTPTCQAAFETIISKLTSPPVLWSTTDHRWLSGLASFDFMITYRAGKAHYDADGLSRVPYTLSSGAGAVPDEDYVSFFRGGAPCLSTRGLSGYL